MFHRIFSLIFTLLLAFVASDTAAQDDAQLRNVFDRLSTEVGRTKERFETSQQIREAANRLSQKVTVLQVKWAKSQRQNLPADYLKDYAMTLQAAVDLLRQSSQERVGEAATLQVLSDVDAEIVTKLSYARGSQGAEDSIGPPIEVTVHTQKGGREVSGYLVRCNPRRYAGSKAMFSFNNPTSPTSKKLPAGNYEMWVEKNDRHAAKRLITVGGDGEAAETIKFDVP